MRKRKNHRQRDLFAPPEPKDRPTITEMNNRYARHLMKPRDKEPKK